MINDITVKRRFSLTGAFAKKTRKHNFRVKNSKLATKRTKITQLLESKEFTIFVLIPTLYLLFIHESISASGTYLTRGLTASVGAIGLVVFFVFSGEIILSGIAYRTSYTTSGLFVLDLIALGSLIPDIVEYLFEVPIDGFSHLSLARIARTARIAARLARMPKFIALLACNSKKWEQAVNVEPSAIARRLELRISTKIVIAMVLVLTVSYLCNPGLDVVPHAKVALLELEAVASATNFSGPLYHRVFDLYTQRYHVLQLCIRDQCLINNQGIIDKTQGAYIVEVEADSANALISVEDEQTVLAGLMITQTVASIIILCGACVLISRDMLVLVVNPVERMLALIKKLTTSLSAYSDSSNRDVSNSSDEEGDDNDDDHDESGEVETRFGNILTESSNDTDSVFREADMIAEFVDILAQEHMELGSQRKMEHQKRKLLVSLVTGVKGWLCRRRYQKMREMLHKREQVANEIISTERTYVTSLQVLSNVFEVPLKDNNIVTIDVVNSIFLGLDKVLTYNIALLEKIEQQFRPWTMHSKLGELFLSSDDMVEAYAAFINNYNNATATVTKYRECNSKFANFIEEQERLPACNHLNIQQFMITPVQRAPRYYLLLEQLLKFTPPDHPDYLPVSSAIESIKRATTAMNERKRDTENRTALHAVYMRLEPQVEVLMEPHCVYVKEGPLVHEGESFMFYLFNCILLKCTPRDGGVRLVVIAEIPITGISIVAPIVDSPHFGIFNALQLESNLNKFLLVAPSQSAQAEWVEAISQCIHKKSNSKPKKDRMTALNLDTIRGSGGTPRRTKQPTVTIQTSRERSPPFPPSSHSPSSHSPSHANMTRQLSVSNTQHIPLLASTNSTNFPPPNITRHMSVSHPHNPLAASSSSNNNPAPSRPPSHPPPSQVPSSHSLSPSPRTAMTRHTSMGNYSPRQ